MKNNRTSKAEERLLLQFFVKWFDTFANDCI